MRSKNLAVPKYQWLAELKQSGLSPKMEVLETVEGYGPLALQGAEHDSEPLSITVLQKA
jgi:hypothetical protein